MTLKKKKLYKMNNVKVMLSIWAIRCLDPYTWGGGDANHSTSRHFHNQQLWELQIFSLNVYLSIHSLNSIFCRAKVLISTIYGIFLL